MSGSARGYALRLIKQRLRSTFEVNQALLKRAVPEEERTALIAELTEVGLLDDKRFALAWVHDRDRFAPRGEFVLRHELSSKGINPTLIAEVLAERRANPTDDIDDVTRAQQLAETQRRKYKGLPEETQRRRLAAYLERRGFSLEVVRRILNA